MWLELESIDDPVLGVLHPLAMVSSSADGDSWNQHEQVIRVVQKFDERGALLCGGDIHEGALVRITRATREDLLAGAVATCERALARLPEPEAAFIFNCAARKMILGHFRERYRKPVDHVGVADTSVKDLGAGASSIVLAREQDRLLLEALRSLSLDDQLVLELYYWEGMTGAELGAVFDCLEPTVRGRLHRAKGRLELELVELSKQHRELAETMTDLDAWAASVREALQPQLQGK